MHDFDQSQREKQQRLTDDFGEHRFTLRGQEFAIRRIIPFAVLRKISGVRDETADADVYEAFETAVLSLLASDDDRKRFLALLEDTTSDFPVTYLDLLEVQNWIIREAAGRPPTRPASSSASPSGNGHAGTGTSSDAPAAASAS